DAMQRFARAQLNDAREELDSHPMEAMHKAQLVQGMDGITDGQRAEAREIERDARRHSGSSERPPPDHSQQGTRHQQESSHNTPPNRTNPEEGSGGNNPPEAAASAEQQARACTMSGDNRCVI